MRSFSLVLVLAACGGTDDPPGDVPPAEQPCVPGDQTTALGAAQSWALGAAAVDAEGPWFVLAKNQDAGSEIVIADATGVTSSPITGIDNTSGFTVATVQIDGKRCFAMHTFDEEFHFVCEGGTVEVPGLDLGGRMIAVQDGGTVHVFGQDFAAYHGLRRTGGTWSQVEKFESSISKAEDAVRSQGNVVSCFLSTADHASIDTLSGDPVYGEGIAEWCRLIPNGSELGVLTNLGYTTFSGSTLGGWQPTAVEDVPLAVGVREGSMFAVMRREDRIELQPLPTGAPTTLTTGTSGAVHAVFADDRVIVTSMTTAFENNQSTATLTASTRCMEN